VELGQRKCKAVSDVFEQVIGAEAKKKRILSMSLLARGEAFGSSTSYWSRRKSIPLEQVVEHTITGQLGQRRGRFRGF
jgi:hypothetical protein